MRNQIVAVGIRTAFSMPWSMTGYPAFLVSSDVVWLP